MMPSYYQNPIDMIFAHGIKDPERIVVETETERLSYKKLADLISFHAEKLTSHGVKEGECVALNIKDELTSLIIILSLVKIGAIVFSIGASESLISKKKELRIFGISKLISNESDSVSVLRVQKLNNQFQNGVPLIGSSDAEKPWLALSGSGSTGEPKMLVLNLQNLFSRALVNSNSIKLNATDRVAMMSTLDYPTPKQRYLEALMVGATVLLLNRTSITKSIAKLRPTILYCTPFHAEMMCKNLTEGSRKLFESIRMFFLSTATVRVELRRRVNDLITDNLFVRYGANETSFIAATSHENLFVENCVGKALPGVEIKIVNKYYEQQPLGVAGYICVKTPGMISEYYQDSVRTEKNFKDGWFITGDLGKLNDEGSLIHLGRADQIMIFNGINVSPVEIESYALESPHVIDALCVSISHPIHQDIPACIVQISEPNHRLLIGEIHHHLKERLGVRAPRLIIPVEKIPKTGNGKINRSELDQLINNWIKAEKPNQ